MAFVILDPCQNEKAGELTWIFDVIHAKILF